MTTKRPVQTRRLDLVEWQTTPAVVLSADQRDLLLGSSIAIRPASGQEGIYDLTPGSEVGAIELPGLSVRVAPKLPIDRVMFLISYAMDGMKSLDTSSQFERQPDLFEAIVAAFTRQVRQAIRPGLLQGYRVEEKALMTVRGRILFEPAIRRFGIAPPIDVRYDEFTVDVDENRIIRAALARLARLRLRSESSRRTLRALVPALAPVSLIECGARPPEIAFTRLNERYRPAVRLAELILRSTSFDLAAGEVTGHSFLIDMNRVFEDFVVNALREELRLTPKEFPQGLKGHRLALDIGGRVALKPDISWWRGRRCMFVGDVKYKKAVDIKAPNADLYQLLAYTTATGLDSGMLIYATGEGEPGVHVVRHAEKHLRVVGLDLSEGRDAVLRSIAGLADVMRASVLRRLP